MKTFWKGFNASKDSPPVRYKKHMIILYWSPDDAEGVKVRDSFNKLSIRYPTVTVKTVNIKKDPLKPTRHKVLASPTIILLKDGREVERLASKDGVLLLENLFRKAYL
jgi:thioredoxin-like negative regulator of GroEL